MKTKIFIPIVLTANLLLGQSFQQKSILTIDDTNQYNVEEFLHVYNKNRDLAEKVDPKTLQEYMDLFVDFKLKVIDAKNEDYDKKEAFLSEYNGYKYQISKNYLTDSSAEEEILKEAYDRMTTQVRASHILISVKENASPEDSLVAYGTAMQVINELKTKPFDDVAVQYSEDPSVKNNKGDLGYFSALQMVYPFENAAYNTEIGNYSQPVRTQFGYHILKVTDKRENPGERQVSHIMLKTTAGKDPVAQQKKIKEIYSKLEAGELFSDLVATYSEDKQSAEKKGRLNWFGTGKMAKPFEDATFGLKENNEYSKPFQTKYGWHIVKLLGKRSIGSYEVEKPYIKRKITKNDRSIVANNAFIDRLKKEYKFTAYKSNIKSFGKLMRKIDFKNLTREDLQDVNKYKKPIFKFSDQVFTQSDFLRVVKQNEDKFSASSNQSEYLYQLLAKTGKEKLIAYEKDQLINKYPEYRLLLQEYHDGMLLYEISKTKIWDKAVKDTLGLSNFHKENADNYKFDNRIKATVYEVADKKTANKVMNLLKKGIELDKIKTQINKNSDLNLNVYTGTFSKGDNVTADQVEWEQGYSKIVKKGTGVSFIYIEELLQPVNKTLLEARGLVISDYQKYLELEWLKTLKANHKIKIDTQLLEDVKKHVN